MSDSDTRELPLPGLILDTSLEELLTRSRAIEPILDPDMLMGRVTLSKATLKRMARKARLKAEYKRRVGRPFIHWKTRKKNEREYNARYYAERTAERKFQMSLTPRGSWQLAKDRWRDNWQVTPEFWEERVWPVVGSSVYTLRGVYSSVVTDSTVVVVDRYSKAILYPI